MKILFHSLGDHAVPATIKIWHYLTRHGYSARRFCIACKCLIITIIVSLCSSTSFAQTLNNFHGTVTEYRNQNLNLDGNTEITITNAVDPLAGSTLNMRSDNVWLYFPAILPSTFVSQHLSHLRINGTAAVADNNVRVDQYLEGTMVISRPDAFNALQVFADKNLAGASLQLRTYTSYQTAQLGSLNNNIESFVLKRGYMATFAQNDLGSGYSRVYIADNADVVINQLPDHLGNEVSFVRVFPWRWTAKKGWTSGRDAAAALKCRWQYDWDNGDTSNYDIEYVPMRHDKYWNSYDNINNKHKSTHALGFNEPDHTDQANMTVQDALVRWPELLKSGLRLGSPAPSDGGLGWLYEFIDNCDALNYRVDFIAVHFYQGGRTARQYYDWLKAIHDRTKRPIWITEWNNGANWTCCTPTYDQQAQAIADFTNMLDTTRFVERYAIYEWVGATRQMFSTAPTSLTAAGVKYRDNLTPMAYNATNVYNPPYFDNLGILAGSTYKVTARHSGKAMDANGAINGATIRQMPYAATSNQQWTLTYTGQGYYRIVCANGGRVLDQDNTTAGASKVLLYDYWGGANQQWQIKSAGGGYFNIINKSTGKFLDVSGGTGATADDTPIIAWTSTGQTNQQWTLSLASGAARMETPVSEADETRFLTEESTHVFPNPVEITLTIRQISQPGNIVIYSAGGQVMKRCSQQSNTVDVSDLSAGMYVIQIFDGERFINERFVKR